jgi:hypothetical protein
VTSISAHRLEVNKVDAVVIYPNVLPTGENIALEAPVVSLGPLNGVYSVDCLYPGWLMH